MQSNRIQLDFFLPDFRALTEAHPLHRRARGRARPKAKPRQLCGGAVATDLPVGVPSELRAERSLDKIQLFMCHIVKRESAGPGICSQKYLKRLK